MTGYFVVGVVASMVTALACGAIAWLDARWFGVVKRNRTRRQMRANAIMRRLAREHRRANEVAQVSGACEPVGEVALPLTRRLREAASSKDSRVVIRGVIYGRKDTARLN